jgi:uncharacterized membrane protein YfcA
MDLALLFAALGLLFAGTVKGAVGFGLPLIAAPVLAGFVGARTAVVVMSLVNLATVGVVVVRTGGVPVRPYAGLLAPILVAICLGVVVGAQLLATLSPTIVSALVGLTAMLFAVLAAARVKLKVPPHQRTLVGSTMGLLGGLLGGTTAVAGTPIVLYLQALGLPKRDFVLLLNLVLMISAIVQFVSYLALDLYTREVLEIAAISLICVSIGLAIGFRIQDRVDQRRFNHLVVILIFAVGLNLVFRAFTA